MAQEEKTGAWPTHADGRPMTIGEMSPEQRAVQIKAACARLKAEMEHPAFAAALSASKED
jgi:hypothetical protein